jgi:hypothetical protein
VEVDLECSKRLGALAGEASGKEGRGKYFKVDRKHGRKLLNAQLLRGVLPAVARLARVFRRREFLAAGEAIETALQGDLVVCGGGLRLLPLGEVADVEAEVHVRVQRSGGVAAVVARHGAGELPVEGLVHDAVAVFCVGRAAVLEVQCVDHELHVLVCVLLLVACECLPRISFQRACGV